MIYIHRVIAREGEKGPILKSPSPAEMCCFKIAKRGYFESSTIKEMMNLSCNGHPDYPAQAMDTLKLHYNHINK